jgi:hypothetical protein
MLTSQCQSIAETAVSLQQRLNWEYGDPQVIRLLANYRIQAKIYRDIRGRLRCFEITRFAKTPALDLAYWRRKQDIVYMAEPNPKVLGGIPNRLYRQWQLTHPRQEAHKALQELRRLGLYAMPKPSHPLAKYYY